MKNITEKRLRELSPCEEGLHWFLNQKRKSVKAISLALIEENRSYWCEWLLSNLLSKNNRIKWAIYAAEQVLDIFEKEYPSDSRPRDAINATKKYLESKTDYNLQLANAAANAAYAAANAAYAAANAANAAANAAYAAANAANAAANAANAAANAANAAAYAANAAAYAAYAAANAAYAAAYAAKAAANAAKAAANAANAAARKVIQIKVALYGIELLEKQK